MATSYITTQDLYSLFGQANIDNAVAETSADLQAIIEASCAEADAYVGQVVALPPLPEAVAIVRRAVADMARYRLFRDAANEDMRKRYEDAVAFLARISAGKVGLPQLQDDPATEEDESLGITFGSEPCRTRGARLL